MRYRNWEPVVSLELEGEADSGVGVTTRTDKQAEKGNRLCST